MMNMFRLLLIGSLAFGLFSCKKETPLEVHTPDPVPPGLFGAATTVNVTGVVLNEAGQPVQGAMVMAGFGSQTTTTDDNGVFQLQGIAGYTKLGLVRVSKNGYFPGSRSFMPFGALNMVRIVLLDRTLAGIVYPSLGGGQALTQGALVDFDAVGFMRNGIPYTGTVYVYMDRVDPGASDFFDRMPGNLLAVQDNSPRLLLSYGMLAVELTDAAGQPVELAPGTTAEVRFPINNAQLGSAPPSIDLWWFDDVEGFWRHEGTATRQGNEFVGQVAHFSFWNVDVPWELAQLTGVVHADGVPLPLAVVTITSSSMGSAMGYTGPDGNFGGFVAAGEPLTFSVSVPCAGGGLEEIHSQVLGAISANTNVGIVEVGGAGISMVSGTVVGCEGLALEQAYVLINGQPFYTNEGVFTVGLCSGSSMTITGVDPLGGVSSAPLTLDLDLPGPVDAGELEACTQSVGPLYTPGSGVTDIDGNVYPSIILNNGQEWMAENLRVANFKDGSTIPNVTNTFDWIDLTTEACCSYNNVSIMNDITYGKLYNWYAAANPNLCPQGWHVPSDAEWQELESALGMPASDIELVSPHRGGAQNVGGKMKATTHWNIPNAGATNASGFTGVAGVTRNPLSGLFPVETGTSAFWWTSTAFSEGGGFRRSLHDHGTYVSRGPNLKGYGLQVRCVRD